MEDDKKVGGGEPSSILSSQQKKHPSDFLKQIIGKPVIVQLTSGVNYKGIIACLGSWDSEIDRFTRKS
jgi:hypothetical protein